MKLYANGSVASAVTKVGQINGQSVGGTDKSWLPNHFVLERENLCKSHHQKGVCVTFAKNLVTLIKNPSGHIRPVEKQACKNLNWRIDKTSSL